jgi:hypothetical protein
MADNYYELIIQGDKKTSRAYLEGFLRGKNIRSGVIFCKDYKISSRHDIKGPDFRHEHLHLICVTGIKTSILSAVKRAPESLSITVEMERALASISFEFSFETFNKEIGAKLKRMFHNPPKGVEIEDFDENEEILPEAKGVEAYAPLHDYQYKGGGKVTGDVEQVLFFHKKLKDLELVDVNDIQLAF